MPYDVFLSYSSLDRTTVEAIARRLHEAGVQPFLDRWFLVQGRRWRAALEETIQSCKAIAVFIGPNGLGRWQQREVDVALDRQAADAHYPVIPVLLPGCEPPLGFLRQLTWIDLRNARPLDEVILELRASIAGEAVGPDFGQRSQDTRAKICPFRGLLVFREEDADFFFGRDSAIGEIASAIEQQSFVAVAGASGSGKSSVIRAGLIPRLRRSRDPAWDMVVMTPTDQPLLSLAGALIPLLEPDRSETERLIEARKLADALADGELGLTQVVRRALEKQPGTDRLLLVADQWEELYTLTTDDSLRRRFIDELLDGTYWAPLTVVATLRGDFVGHALAYRPLSDRLQGAQVNLGPMTRDELARAVREPARLVGLNFQEGLDSRVLDAVGEEPGSLPLLEFVLRQRWEERRGGLLIHEAYESMGELRGALAAKAEKIFIWQCSPCGWNRTQWRRRSVAPLDASCGRWRIQLKRMTFACVPWAKRWPRWPRGWNGGQRRRRWRRIWSECWRIRR
ncbi:MAG: TIR domain-containing protein [Verrucomicrobiales bacterium]|nr:TIR domain-containing protein [Verrucomicrobiales bacterium]